VKLLLQDNSTQQPKKAHVNPNMAFPFKDDFFVGTIHGTNAKAPTPSAAAAPSAAEVVEIQDNRDNVSVLSAKTASKAQSKSLLEAGLPPAPTPLAAQPPTLLRTEPPAEDWKMRPAMVRPVEP
jgi:hypothetical protein